MRVFLQKKYKVTNMGKIQEQSFVLVEITQIQGWIYIEAKKRYPTLYQGKQGL